jgi:hypothetical protein
VTVTTYAASARIDRANPRLDRGAARRSADTPWRSAADESSEPLLVEVTPVPTERWQAFRERWSQLTFFLFDPESWR